MGLNSKRTTILYFFFARTQCTREIFYFLHVSCVDFEKSRRLLNECTFCARDRVKKAWSHRTHTRRRLPTYLSGCEFEHEYSIFVWWGTCARFAEEKEQNFCSLPYDLAGHHVACGHSDQIEGIKQKHREIGTRELRKLSV